MSTEINIAEELYNRVDETLSELQSYPERFSAPAEKIWEYLFSHMDGELEWVDDRGFCDQIPLRDCDYEGGWRQSTYTVNMIRALPAGTADAGSPQGIEALELWEYDEDGNAENEASFIRWQPGLEITEEDRKRAKEIKENDPRKHYGSLCLTRAHALLAGEAEEYWDPSEFQHCMMINSAVHRLLQMRLYDLHCVMHGEDPLGNVLPEREDRKGTLDMTITREYPYFEGKLVEGDERLMEEALVYVADHSFDDIAEIVRKHPKGIPLDRSVSAASLKHGWEPREVTDESITLRVFIEGRFDVPITVQAKLTLVASACLNSTP